MANFDTVRKQAAFHLITWLSRNRDRWPRWAACILAAAAVLILAAFGTTLLHPAAGEIVQNTLITIGVVINVGLVAMAVLLFVAVAAKSAGQVVILETSGVRLLTAGVSREPDLSPDVLIALRPGETDEQFMRRLEQAASECGSGRWVVVIPFRHPAGMIYETPTRYREFLRDNPPFQSDTWTDDQKVCPPATYFRDELVSDYRAYLERFAFYFREWAARVKVTGEEQPGRKLEILKDGIRSSLNTMFFALLTLPCFAQNAAAVSQALGTRIREIPEAGTEVLYEFERRDMMRVADGKKNYVELLKSAPMYSDSRGGKFVALHAGGRVIARADGVGQVAAPYDPVRPRGAAVPATDQPVSFSLPDSNEVARRVDDFRRDVSFYKSAFWKASKPYWEIVMLVFWALFPILLLAGVVLRFWASLAAAEEMPDIHWHSSRALVFIVGSVWTVGIMNAVLTVIWSEPTPFWLCFWGAVILIVAWKTATWIVPNMRARPGGRTAFFSNVNNSRPALPNG